MITLEIFEKALIFAVKAHSGQIRKGVDEDGFSRPYILHPLHCLPVSYILHPLNVMQKIFNNKVSKNIYLLASAAILHDSLEDVEWVTLEMITELFGEQIASLVDELTINKEESKKIGKKDYLVNKMNSMSSYALAIKLCDRLDNVSDLETMDKDFRNYYVKQTNYILGKLDRKLSNVHKKLIEEIYSTINKYE